LTLSILFTAFIIGGNTLLRPLVNAINRIPVSERSSEATYEVRVMTTMDQMTHAREHVQESLEAAHYPVSDVQIIDRPGNVVDLVATLISTSINPNELDAVVAALGKLDCVTSAAWSSRTIV
jgi:putative Mg2+ transporter-C (MgtC) family protein